MGDNKYIINKPPISEIGNLLKHVQIGVVADVNDPQSFGRIKVRIPGPAQKGGDDGITVDKLPWCIPMIPKYFTSTPKVGEGVFIIILSDNKTHSDRLYFGPIISQLSNLNLDLVNSTSLEMFTFTQTKPNPDYNTIPALKGVFPKIDDISIQGRYNTDLIFRKNEILLRSGKFVESTPNQNNPFSFQFNTDTPAYIQLKNNIPIEKVENKQQKFGSVTNIVGNKINLLTHKDGNPRFDLANQDDQLTDNEILNILENAHPLPFGDLLVKYLKLLKNAFLNHVHNGNGSLPPTDLTTSGTLSVQEFKKEAENLENTMLSKNIRIN